MPNGRLHLDARATHNGAAEGRVDIHAEKKTRRGGPLGTPFVLDAMAHFGCYFEVSGRPRASLACINSATPASVEVSASPILSL